MIHSIRSNHSSFKDVRFNTGFNVVLADRNRGGISDDKQTRNGAGKTTLVEIIHFCLGAQVKKDSVFKNKKLQGWSFILELDIGNDIFEIERFTDNPYRIFINGNTSKLNMQYDYDNESKRFFVIPKEFNRVMLEQMYGIKQTDKEHMLSFRELISYTVRRNVEGYKNAFEYFSKQQAHSIQICNAFFLNLSTDYAFQFQQIKEKKKKIDSYLNAAKSGTIGSFSLSIGELSTEVITRQKDVDQLKKQLDEYKIHPQYEKISKEADDITTEIHSLANNLLLRKLLLQKYEICLKKEKNDLLVSDIERVYAEVGIVFKEFVQRSLSEVFDFHKTIVSNRKEFLNNEIILLQKEIDDINDKILSLSNHRSDIMKILETHGALDEYVLIQDCYAKAKQKLEDTKIRLEYAEQIEDSKSRLKIENQELLIKSRQDYNERIEMREQAISLFKYNTEFLYPEAGVLTIDLKET